jgi:hypothetical protein
MSKPSRTKQRDKLAAARGRVCFRAATGREEAMPREKTLKPDDFPVEAKENNVVTQHDEPVATAPSREKADDVARRLNEQAAREEEDRWSA